MLKAFDTISKVPSVEKKSGIGINSETQSQINRRCVYREWQFSCCIRHSQVFSGSTENNRPSVPLHAPFLFGRAFSAERNSLKFLKRELLWQLISYFGISYTLLRHHSKKAHA